MTKSQSELDKALRRLEELQAYRQMYATSGQSKPGRGAMQWQDYHRFLNRLDQAVVEQQRLVSDGRTNREVHRQRWMAKKQRLESLSRIVDRFRKEEIDTEERRLQKEQDGLPLSRGLYRRTH